MGTLARDGLIIRRTIITTKTFKDVRLNTEILYRCNKTNIIAINDERYKLHMLSLQKQLRCNDTGKTGQKPPKI